MALLANQKGVPALPDGLLGLHFTGRVVCTTKRAGWDPGAACSL